MSDIEKSSDFAALTVQLLSAYLANNTVASEDLAGLIRSTRTALAEDSAPPAPEPEAATYTPAVSVRKSLASPAHIISLIDGKPYKTLKRHLARHGLTPDAYRERYNLPTGYPMVAPDFAAYRRAIAEKIGLGNRRWAAAAPTEASLQDGQEQEAPAVAVPGKRVAKSASRKPTRLGKAAAKSADKADIVSDVAEQLEDVAVASPSKKRATQAGSNKAGKRPTKKVESAATQPDVANVEAPVSPGQVQNEAPKRRGKLGLFGKTESGGTKAQVEEGATAAAAEDAGSATPKAPAKATRRPRMARDPK